ncbi:MAG: type I-C CRISPR-associated protein Cas8c/Csd1 [Candidatus Omnitrophota bacterium]|nr:type I-C CRISPR-associated protein Cas8c/Csd1 [Candidatus Omnitrophota bacterium]
MIIQSLVSLYDRLGKDDKVPAFGFSVEAIGFSIVIDQEGNLIGEPQDLRTPIKANVYDYYPSIVPYSNKVNVRSSGGAATTPNFIERRRQLDETLFF